MAASRSSTKAPLSYAATGAQKRETTAPRVLPVLGLVVVPVVGAGAGLVGFVVRRPVEGRFVRPLERLMVMLAKAWFEVKHRLASHHAA